MWIVIMATWDHQTIGKNGDCIYIICIYTQAGACICIYTGICIYISRGLYIYKPGPPCYARSTILVISLSHST